jgi:hypothetical protein
MSNGGFELKIFETSEGQTPCLLQRHFLIIILVDIVTIVT